MMKTIAVVLLCASLTASAASSPFDADVTNTTTLNPDCPVALTGIYAGSVAGKGPSVSVHFVNQTEKRLIAIKLGLAGYDASRDRHDFPEEYAVAVNLKPQKEAKPIWQVRDVDFSQEITDGMRVYVEKLIFFDGTTWKDDGSQSCSLAILGEAKPDRSHDE